VRDGIPTTFIYHHRRVKYSDTVGLEAWLKTTMGDPLSGMSVKYFLDANQDNSFNPATEYIGTSVTDANGFAPLAYTAWLAPGVYSLRAEFDGSDPYLPSSAQSQEFFLAVEKEVTVVTYSGDTSSRTGQTVTLAAVLTDDEGNPIVGRDLSFTLGTQSAAAVTQVPGGVGSTDLQLTQPQGQYTVATAFAGDTYYAAASDSDPFLLNDPPTIVDVRGVWGSRTASILGRDILPWSQIRAIEIVFSDDVDVQQDDLVLAGQTTGAKTSTGFLYNSGTKTARWEFAALAIDWYMMTLDGDDDAGDGNVGVKDLLGDAYLDGGDYERRFGVLTGDYNGDGLVNSQDTGLISRKFGSLDVFADLDGDGDVDAADMRIASAMRGKRIPI
jgi:hypothetical protein